MSASIVQSGFTSAGGGNTVTFSSAPANGNWLIAILVHFQNNPGTSAGWTNLFIQNGVADAGVSVFYKLCGAGESTSQVPCTGGGQRSIGMWEVSGLTGTWATDYQQRKNAVDVASVTPAYTTTSFNTSAANTMILGMLNGEVANTVTETGAPTVTGGVSPTVDQAYVSNGVSDQRHAAYSMVHDFFATNGTAVQYTATFPINQNTGQYCILAFNWTALATTVTLGLASETDSALAITSPAQGVTLGIASETDTALALSSPTQSVTLGLASETDAARAMVPASRVTLALAGETDAALGIIPYTIVRWPFSAMKPRHIGIYPCAATLGGGVALTGKEPVIESGAGFWKIFYGSVRLRDLSARLTWREFEAILEGRGKMIVIPIYDGKRAPWPGGVAGAAIDIEANADAAKGDTALEILVNAAATPEVGMHFSAGYWLYRIKDIEDLGGGVFAVNIWPKLRADIASGDALEFARPVLRARLETDDAMALDLNLLRFGDPDVSFVEAL